MKRRIRLIHWREDEAQEKGQLLADLGFAVDSRVPQNFRFMKPLRENPPDGILIDLSWAPARGRDVALMVRQSPRTRQVPILFLDGLASKRSEIREQIPDATYLQWGEVGLALPLILEHLQGSADLCVCLDALASFPQPPRVWVCWPKKSSGVRTKMSASVIQDIARQTDWVEYKVCSIDRVWSGKLFCSRDKSDG